MKKVLLIMLMFAPLSIFAQKFAHVNTENVLKALPEVTKVQQELEQLGKKYEDELKASQAELERLVNEYDKNKSTMNATKQKETEESLQEKYQRISEQAQQNQQAFQKAQSDKLQPIYQRVKNAIEMVGKNGGYVYVMEAGSVLYINDSLSKDITSEVKAQLLSK